jgi:hypothetical protein
MARRCSATSGLASKLLVAKEAVADAVRRHGRPVGKNPQTAASGLGVATPQKREEPRSSQYLLVGGPGAVHSSISIELVLSSTPSKDPLP